MGVSQGLMFFLIEKSKKTIAWVGLRRFRVRYRSIFWERERRDFRFLRPLALAIRLVALGAWRYWV